MQFNSKTHHLCQSNNLYFHSSKHLKRNNITGFLFCLIAWDNTEPKTPNLSQNLLTEFLSSNLFWSCVYITYRDLLLAILREVFGFQILWICNSISWHYCPWKTEIHDQSWSTLRSICEKASGFITQMNSVSLVKRKKKSKSSSL